MLFNSLEFLLFFTGVYAVYLCLKRRGQNNLLLAASYVFYGVWDMRFLGLILFETVINYLIGAAIFSIPQGHKRKLLLTAGVCVNLAVLFFFKYFNFFEENAAALLQKAGFQAPLSGLRILLPVGISFYAFQAMSYLFDLYNGKIKPAKHFADFALFVAFFPQLVAGPIERSYHLLPQIEKSRTVSFDGIRDGISLVLWGYLQKILIADNLALVIDPVFAHPGPYNGFVICLVGYGFLLQIFCDFAGYSNIARGLSKMMGIELMVNFRAPLTALNIQEFWRRWHISLTTWVRDYLYIPLGGSRGGFLLTCRNILICFTLIGLWHGAAWTFVLFGLSHGLMMIFYLFFKKHVLNRVQAGTRSLLRIGGWLLLQAGLIITFIMFRSVSLAQLQLMLTSIFTRFMPAAALQWRKPQLLLGAVVFFSLIVLLTEWIWDQKSESLKKQPAGLKLVFLYGVLLAVLAFGSLQVKQFIYFQF